MTCGGLPGPDVTLIKGWLTELFCVETNLDLIEALQVGVGDE